MSFAFKQLQTVKAQRLDFSVSVRLDRANLDRRSFCREQSDGSIAGFLLFEKKMPTPHLGAPRFRFCAYFSR
jgi:hypothetical protein